MNTAKTVRHLVIALAITVGGSTAHAQTVLERLTPPPPPRVTIDPPRPDRAPSLTVENPQGSATLHADPMKPAPNVQSTTGNQTLDDSVSKANKTIQDAQNQAAVAAKQAAQFPLKAAEDALKIVGDAAKKAIQDIVEAAKKALEGQIDALWKEYQFYVYLAGVGLFLILMTPALIAAWIVRRIGRKRERKMEAALNAAMKLLRAYAEQAGVKIAA